MKRSKMFLVVLMLLAWSSSVWANVLIAAGGKLYDLDTATKTLSAGMYANLGVNQIASVASNGDVVIATSGGHLYKYTKDGVLVGSYTAANLLINDIAVDAAGNIGVASGYGQYRFNSTITWSNGPIYGSSAPLTKILNEGGANQNWIAMIGSNGYWLATNNANTSWLGTSSIPYGPNVAVDSSGSILMMVNSYGKGYRAEDYQTNPFGTLYGPYGAGWTDTKAIAIDPATDNIYLAAWDKFYMWYADFSAYNYSGPWGAGWSVKDMIFDAVTGKLVVATTYDTIGIYSVGPNGITAFDGYVPLPQGGIGTITDLASSKFAVVPEPATVFILGLGSLLAARMRKA